MRIHLLILFLLITSFIAGQGESEKPDEAGEKSNPSPEKVVQEDEKAQNDKSIHADSKEQKVNISADKSNEKEVRLESGPDEADEGEAVQNDQNPSDNNPPLQVLQSDDVQNEDQAILEGNPASKNINEESKDGL